MDQVLSVDTEAYPGSCGGSYSAPSYFAWMECFLEVCSSSPKAVYHIVFCRPRVLHYQNR